MTPEEIKALQDKLSALEAENKKLKETPPPAPKKEDPPPPKPEDDPDLKKKADRERAEKEARDAESKRMESAVEFNLGVKKLVEEAGSLLPETMKGILATAEKEKYGSHLERANAVRSGMILEFFSIAENVELLTAQQKEQLKAFQSLAKNVREERAETYYNNVFEPALEMNRRILKAKEVAKAEMGYKYPSNTEDAFVKKMAKFSRQFYLGEKETA